MSNSFEQNQLRAVAAVIPPASHADCMVCGEHGHLGLRFSATQTGVEALFRANPEWQGYAGCLHGGMISTLLDAAMTHCLFSIEVEAMTADLQVRFIKPVPCYGQLLVQARLISQRRKVYMLAAELCHAGEILVHADGKFMNYKRT